jgi:hypothetical protein
VKRIISVLVLSVLFLLLLALPASATPKVIVDGRTLTFDVQPGIEQGTTLVPLRGVFESIGAFVSWDGATETITAIKGATEIQLKVGSTTAYRNGTPVTPSVPAKVVRGSTLAPLRFVSEALGADVGWDGTTQTISIVSGTSAPGVTTDRPVVHPVQTSGTLRWTDGTTYTGGLKDGRPHGQGTMTWPDGGQLTGNWENGLVHGHGVETHPNGFRYEGQWEQGKRSGQGTMTLPDGFRYTGAFKDGLRHGSGTGTWPDGTKYVGQWENGLPHGQGTTTFPDWQQILAAMVALVDAHRAQQPPYQPFPPGTPTLPLPAVTKLVAKLYPDFGHPNGIGATPWFRIKDNKLYPDFGHPGGISPLPWFQIR